MVWSTSILLLFFFSFLHNSSRIYVLRTDTITQAQHKNKKHKIFHLTVFFCQLFVCVVHMFLHRWGGECAYGGWCWDSPLISLLTYSLSRISQSDSELTDTCVTLQLALGSPCLYHPRLEWWAGCHTYSALPGLQKISTWVLTLVQLNGYDTFSVLFHFKEITLVPEGQTLPTCCSQDRLHRTLWFASAPSLSSGAEESPVPRLCREA